MKQVLYFESTSSRGNYCTKRTASASGVAKWTGQNGTLGDSRGVPLSVLSDPLSHCKYVTYSRVIRD